MFESLRAPFTQSISGDLPVVRTGAWLLKLGALLAMLAAVVMAGMVLVMMPGLLAYVTDGQWRTMLLAMAMQMAVTLGIGVLMASMFGTTLLRWEERDPKARPYALVLGWFLALTGALGMWQALTGPVTLGMSILAPQAVQTALGIALLWATYHPQTRAAMRPSPMPSLPSR